MKKYVSSKYVSIHICRSTILDSVLIYLCNVDILLQMVPESAAGQTTTSINTFTQWHIHNNLSILLVNKWNNQMRHDQTIGTTSFMVKWYEVGTTTMCYKSWEAWTILKTRYFAFNIWDRNLSILLVNKWNNQRRLDQTNGTTSFMVKWYEVEITTMCYISWEACKNTENKLFCFQNIGPNILWSK